MKSAIYTRVSTRDKQDPENQLRELEAYARQRDWEIVKVYSDRETGSTSERPAFQAMFEDARRGRFDVVLFWALDRFSREGTLRTIQLLEELTARNVKWVSLSERYIDAAGPFAEVLIAVMACLAKQERLRLIERVRAGIDRARAQGKELGRPKKIFDRGRVVELRRRGKPWKEIAAELGAGVRTVQRAYSDRRAA